ncbi:DUF2304 domain-containing protein [Arcanobacterium pinnipediorum]|uniref:DUF2304 domain-containing protein n=1 Tax=Arcanobacterium pinnipediorum TaxID=1503041 RepID=A0ABY5AHH7_9ACTO|nr:DUF2304 domain-containing protein [Arcanobacterium pinnipediorum]USR79461.1 DUF2304 domain-containing protein [Arcanobacterium pinnipediorum]
MTTIQIVSLIVIVLIGIQLIRLVRNRVLKEKYMWLWLCLDFLALITALWPAGLYALTSIVGFDVPANMIFFVVIAVLVVMEIHQAIAVSKLEEERRRLAEEIAILHHEVSTLKQSL